MTDITKDSLLSNILSSPDILENLIPSHPSDNLFTLFDEKRIEYRQLWFKMVDVYEELALTCENDDGIAIDEMEEVATTLSAQPLARPLLEANPQNQKGIDKSVDKDSESKTGKKHLKEKKTSLKKISKTSALKVKGSVEGSKCKPLKKCLIVKTAQEKRKSSKIKGIDLSLEKYSKCKVGKKCTKENKPPLKQIKKSSMKGNDQRVNEDIRKAGKKCSKENKTSPYNTDKKSASKTKGIDQSVEDSKCEVGKTHTEENKPPLKKFKKSSVKGIDQGVEESKCEVGKTHKNENKPPLKKIKKSPVKGIDHGVEDSKCEVGKTHKKENKPSLQKIKKSPVKGIDQSVEDSKCEVGKRHTKENKPPLKKLKKSPVKDQRVEQVCKASKGKKTTNLNRTSSTIKGNDQSIKEDTRKAEKKCSEENKTSPYNLDKKSASKTKGLFNETKKSDKTSKIVTKKFVFGCANIPIKVCHCGMINVF